MTTTTPALLQSLGKLSLELMETAVVVSYSDPVSAERFTALIAEAPRVFVFGAGRSGLALRMTAMRLMHVGLNVHVVGETTAPAIGRGDVLFTASGSGTTGSVIGVAENAKKAGAQLAVITTDPASPLALLADELVLVPAPEKRNHENSSSMQYSGSLFEQIIVLVGDALFHTVWQRTGDSAETLWTRHANLE